MFLIKYWYYLLFLLNKIIFNLKILFKYLLIKLIIILIFFLQNLLFFFQFAYHINIFYLIQRE